MFAHMTQKATEDIQALFFFAILILLAVNLLGAAFGTIGSGRMRRSAAVGLGFASGVLVTLATGWTCVTGAGPAVYLLLLPPLLGAGSAFAVARSVSRPEPKRPDPGS
jgi:hypothetical protein